MFQETGVDGSAESLRLMYWFVTVFIRWCSCEQVLVVSRAVKLTVDTICVIIFKNC